MKTWTDLGTERREVIYGEGGWPKPEEDPILLSFGKGKVCRYVCGNLGVKTLP